MILPALLIGIVAGLRTMTAPAAIIWAIWLEWSPFQGPWFAFLRIWEAPVLMILLMVVELVTDLLPGTPSRKSLPQFGARLVSGALSGAAIGAAQGPTLLIAGFVAGMIGAVIGTLGGAAARGWLASALGNDAPAALIEDAAAIIGAFLIIQIARYTQT